MTQCQRCLDFGHGPSNCNKNPKCLKYSKEHFTKDCSQADDAQPTCANCKQNHKANYTGCPTYVKRLEFIEKQKQTKNKNTVKPSPSYSAENFPQPKWTGASQPSTTRQWVSITKPPAVNTVRTDGTNLINSFNELEKEIQELNKLCNINEMLNLVKKLNQKLKNCSTPMEKLQVFAQIITDDGE